MAHSLADFSQWQNPAFVGGRDAPVNGGKRRFVLLVEDRSLFAEVLFLHLGHTPTVALKGLQRKGVPAATSVVSRQAPGTRGR